MKITQILVTAVVSAVLAFSVGAYFFPFPWLNATIKPDVMLVISAAGGGNFELNVTGGPQSCNTSNHVGCVRVEKDEDAEIKFNLTGLPNWNFKKLQLVAGCEKLDFGAQANFTAEMKDDFYVTVGGVDRHPDDNGIIDLTGLANGREFVLNDNNTLRQYYLYQIEACNGGTCEPTDPKIENEG